MPTYKDINLLTQKAAMSGTEKLPVSDTEYITPAQIIEQTVIKDKGFNGGSTLAIVDENSESIVQFKDGHIKTKYFDSEAVLTQIGDIETLLAAI